MSCSFGILTQRYLYFVILSFLHILRSFYYSGQVLLNGWSDVEVGIISCLYLLQYPGIYHGFLCATWLSRPSLWGSLVCIARILCLGFSTRINLFSLVNFILLTFSNPIVAQSITNKIQTIKHKQIKKHRPIKTYM